MKKKRPVLFPNRLWKQRVIWQRQCNLGLGRLIAAPWFGWVSVLGLVLGAIFRFRNRSYSVRFRKIVFWVQRNAFTTLNPLWPRCKLPLCNELLRMLRSNCFDTPGSSILCTLIHTTAGACCRIVSCHFYLREHAVIATRGTSIQNIHTPFHSYLNAWLSNLSTSTHMSDMFSHTPFHQQSATRLTCSRRQPPPLISNLAYRPENNWIKKNKKSRQIRTESIYGDSRSSLIKSIWVN